MIQQVTYSVLATSPKENLSDQASDSSIPQWLDLLIVLGQVKNIMSKSQQPTLSTIQQDQLEELPIQEAKRTFFIGLTVEILYSVARATMVLILVVMAASIEVESMRQKNGYERMQEVIGLWEKQIIVEFRVTNTLNCPELFEEYTQDQWSGTLQGCLCSTPLGLYSYDLVFRGRCNERQFAHGCLTVPAHEPKLYTFWKKDAHLCVRRLKNYNFYSSLSDIINPNGYPPKKCAEGQPYQIDLVSVLQCPVTSLVNGTGMQQVIDDLNFSYNREDDYPVASFRITEYAFCQDYSKENVSPGRKSNYILETVAKEECGEIDERIVELDGQDQIAFFGNNPGIEAIIETLPDYPLPDGHFSYKLGYNRYPPWSYTCRQSDSLSLATTSAFLTLSSLSAEFNTCRIALLVLLSLQFFYIMYYWISSYLYLKEKDQQGYLYLKDYQIKKINKRSNIGRQCQNQIMKFVVLQIFGVAVLVISVAAYSKASQNQEWVKTAYGCTTDLVKGYLQEYQEFFGAMVVVAMSCVFLAAGLIALDLLFLLWRRWKGDLQLQEDKARMQLDIESDDFSSIQPKQLTRIAIQVTEDCLVANINTQQTLKEEDRVKKMLFQIDDEIEGSDSSRYSSNQSEKSS